MKKDAIVIGSTGMTGRLLVDELIQSEKYSKVHIVHYKPTIHKNKPKIIEHIINFDEFTSLKITDEIQDFYCTIGTTIKTAGTPEAFRKVDLEYVKLASDWAKANNIEQFVTISSMGANKESGNLYLRTKGEMEEYLTLLNFPKLTIVRPPLLYGEKRPDFRIGELLGKWFMIPLGWFVIGIRPMKITDLAKKLLRLGQDEYKGHRFLNPKQLHK